MMADYKILLLLLQLLQRCHCYLLRTNSSLVCVRDVCWTSEFWMKDFSENRTNQHHCNPIQNDMTGLWKTGTKRHISSTTAITWYRNKSFEAHTWILKTSPKYELHPLIRYYNTTHNITHPLITALYFFLLTPHNISVTESKSFLQMQQESTWCTNSRGGGTLPSFFIPSLFRKPTFSESTTPFHSKFIHFLSSKTSTSPLTPLHFGRSSQRYRSFANDIQATLHLFIYIFTYFWTSNLRRTITCILLANRSPIPAVMANFIRIWLAWRRLRPTPLVPSQMQGY